MIDSWAASGHMMHRVCLLLCFCVWLICICPKMTQTGKQGAACFSLSAPFTSPFSWRPPRGGEERGAAVWSWLTPRPALLSMVWSLTPKEVRCRTHVINTCVISFTSSTPHVTCRDPSMYWKSFLNWLSVVGNSFHPPKKVSALQHNNYIDASEHFYCFLFILWPADRICFCCSLKTPWICNQTHPVSPADWI